MVAENPSCLLNVPVQGEARTMLGDSGGRHGDNPGAWEVAGGLRCSRLRGPGGALSSRGFEFSRQGDDLARRGDAVFSRGGDPLAHRMNPPAVGISFPQRAGTFLAHAPPSPWRVGMLWRRCRASTSRVGTSPRHQNAVPTALTSIPAALRFHPVPSTVHP